MPKVYRPGNPDLLVKGEPDRVKDSQSKISLVQNRELEAANVGLP